MSIAVLPPALVLGAIAVNDDTLSDWFASLKRSLVFGSIWKLDEVVFIHVVLVFNHFPVVDGAVLLRLLLQQVHLFVLLYPDLAHLDFTQLVHIRHRLLLLLHLVKRVLFLVVLTLAFPIANRAAFGE